MIYYIDPIGGRDDTDGTSPVSARKTYTDMEICPGDTILFRRGSYIRDCLYRHAGAPDAYITYGAYGEGKNPVFCGSADVSAAEDWKEVSENVWKYQRQLPSEVCNFIFDDGRIGGTLRWEEEMLCAQGDWYDSHMGSGEQKLEEVPDRVLLYSKGNPGLVYTHIECALRGQRTMSQNTNYTIIEDLCFFGSGVHALSGGAHHMIVRRCSFCFIGGAVWNRQLRIRFGNAIEFWNIGEDICIENCYFNNIYDSCITQQGSDVCLPAANFVMRHNLFINYGMGAYEGRDRMLVNSEFTDNLCIYAGGGFAGFGDTKPRNSEIYPQPMGHHLFMWRISAASPNGSFSVRRNIFYEAEGAAIYAIIAEDAIKQMQFSENIYYTTNGALLNRIGDTIYTCNDFAAYGEKSAVWEKVDIDAAVAAWFQSTGADTNGTKLYTDKLPAPIYFTGSTTKDALSYQPDEDMCFRLQLKRDGKTIPCAKFLYEVHGDDGRHETYEADGSSGMLEIHTACSRPGYVYVRATACNADGSLVQGSNAFEGGACAAFDAVQPAEKEPADFDTFWQNMLITELDTMPPLCIEQKEFFCGDPADMVFDLKIQCPGPAPVSGYLRIPRKAADHSLPLRIGYLGYNVTSAPIPTKANEIQFFINQHGTENGRPASYYHMLAAEQYAGFGFDTKENEQPDTVYFKYMILRAIQAVRYGKTLPAWDGKTIILCGGSMGAFQAVSAAAWQRDVTKLEIAIPWMCDLRGEEIGRRRGWRPDAAHGLDYYDTVYSAKRLVCPVHIFAGLGDEVCPPSGVTALFHNIQSEKHLVMAQNRTHSYEAPEFERYVR